MNAADIILLLLIAAAVMLAVRACIRRKKSGCKARSTARLGLSCT